MAHRYRMGDMTTWPMIAASASGTFCGRFSSGNRARRTDRPECLRLLSTCSRETSMNLKRAKPFGSLIGRLEALIEALDRRA